MKDRKRKEVKISRFPVYEEYKPSSVLKDDNIPAHWQEKPLKYILKERKIKSIDGKGKLLMVSQTHGVVERSKFHEKAEVAESTIGHKKCNKNDLIFNKLKAHLGVFFQTPLAGLVSPDYAVYYQTGQVNVKYLEYLFRHPAYIASFTRAAKGIVDGLKRLYTSDLFSIHSICPPAPEQEAILQFIDHKTTLINDFIARKERLIELLQEQKRVIINQAVTKGIDPGVRLKPSGVDWLGDIPEHWEVKRLKFIATITTGDKDTVDKVSDGKYPFFVRSQIAEKINSYSFDGEAVLTAGDGAGVAKVFHYVTGKFDFHQRVYKFSDFRWITGKFFYFYMRNNLYKEVLKLSAKSTVDSLRRPMFQNFIMTIPPAEEQKKILTYIENKSKIINAAIAKANQEIILIKEYRESLIAEAVTGKIDVRGWRKQREKAA